MNLAVWSLVAFGITTIISISKIFKPVREWVSERNQFISDMIACSMCLGFWVGILLSLTLYSPTGNFFFDACLSSAVCWILYCITWFFALRYNIV